MKNKILHIELPQNIPLYIERQINKYHLQKCEQTGNYYSTDYVLIVSDASEFKTTDDFFVEIGKKFKFHDDDIFWEDQEWRTFMYFNDLLHSIHYFIPQKRITLIIQNLSTFNPPKTKEMAEPSKNPGNDYYANGHHFIHNFEHYLLPFYENEVKECFRKKFDIYYT